MALICAISGEVPEHPVLSLVSKQVFERRLIEKYLAEHGTDPVSGEPLSDDMIVDIKTTPVTKPKPPSATSIPAILKALQDEWDSAMLHSFTLRQQLQTARQELSHALYQHDAACRVIARLSKEATAAREALATLKPQAGISNIPAAISKPKEAVVAAVPSKVAEAMEVDKEAEEAGMSEEVLQKLQDKATLLTSERRKRGKKPPEDLCPVESIKAFTQISSHPGLHSASVPGILSLDLQDSDPSKAITGGMDKNAVVFHQTTEQVAAVLKGHTKKVTGVIYHPQEEIAITGSADSTVRVWNISSASCSHIIKAHSAGITGVSLHATGDYVLTSSSDEHWAFSDINTGRVLCKGISDPNSSQALTCAQFHPDGLIFGTGTSDSAIKIWDLKVKANVANFPGHSGPISCISFSENGYYLATAADDSVVKLWDLRKLKNFKTIPLDESEEIKALCFDKSGQYLAVAGTNIGIYLVKQWDLLKTLSDFSAVATSVKFGRNAEFLASVGMDRNLRYFARK